MSDQHNTLLYQIKQRITCESAARQLSDKVWSAGNDALHFKYNGCNDGSSAFLYTKTNSWCCYRLGFAGDVIDLVEFILYGTCSHGRTTNFRAAITRLLDMTGLSDNKDTVQTEESKEYATSRKARELMNDICNYAQLRLTENPDKILQITSRGISEKTIKAFRLGFLNRAHANDLLVKLDGVYGAQLVNDCGVTVGEGAERRLLLSNSIVIPLIYGGVVRNFIAYQDKGRYLRMRKTMLLEHSACPFGLDSLTDFPQGTPIMIVEGIFDALSAYEACYPCIATLGTSPSKAAYQMIIDVCRNGYVRIVNDHDENGAGWRAAINHAKMFLTANIAAYVIRLSPALFDKVHKRTTKGYDTAEVILSTMTVSEMADLFAFSKNKMITMLGKVNISPEGEFVQNAQAAIDALRTAKVFPKKAIVTDGVLADLIEHPLPAETKKIDLNDIWILVNKNKEALGRLSERALPALHVVIEDEVHDKNITRSEYLRRITSVVSRYSLPKDDVIAALISFGLSTADIESITKNDGSLNVVRKYAEAMLNIVDTIQTEDRPLMFYDERTGIWTQKSEPFYNNLLMKYIIPRTETVADMWRKIQQDVQALSYSNDNPFKMQGRFIILNNGTYDTQTWSFIPSFDKNNYATTNIPISFYPEAKAPSFLRFLREIFIKPEDEGIDGFEQDCANKIAYVEEMLGLLMVPDTSFQVFWTFLGSGGNGKSTLQNIIYSLLGGSNVSTVSLAQMANRFAIVNMVNKLVNITSEKEYAPSADTVEIVKRIVGEEPIQVEAKYTPAYSTNLTTRLIISANQPIRWPIGDAMERRQRNALLSFPCLFPESCERPEGRTRPRNRTIVSDVMKESAGILNLALAGLRRLRDRGTLRQLAIENEVLRDTMEAEPVYQFLFKRLRHLEVGGFNVKMKDIHTAFSAWLKANYPDERVPALHGAFRSALDIYIRKHMDGSAIRNSTDEIGRSLVVTKAYLASNDAEAGE